ncbi:MAG: LysE family translocator [Rhodospirillales bacterium]
MPELIGPLVLFALAMALTPGPNNIMVTASAANFGFRRVMPHMLGVTLGFALMLLALGLGLGGLFQTEPRLHLAMKYLGAAYLLYLAWRIARAGESADGAGRPRPITFFEAVLFQWVNPKAWIIALGALTAYTTVGGSMTREVALIVGVFAVVTFPSLAVWASFGAGLGRWLGDPRVRAAFNWSMAALLVLSLVPVFW